MTYTTRYGRPTARSQTLVPQPLAPRPPALAIAATSLAFIAALGLPVTAAETGRLDDEKKNPVQADPVIRIDPTLRKLAETQKTLPVIIFFAQQPQHRIAADISARYEPLIDKLAAEVRALYSKHKPVKAIESKEEESNYSKLLEQYVTDEDRQNLAALNRERDALSTRMRKEIAEASTAAVRDVQSKYIDQLSSYGAKIVDQLTTLNAVSAELPADRLEAIADIRGIAEIVYDAPGKPELDNQVQSLGAASWWNTGFDGGVWDVGVLDGGVVQSHSALSGHTAYDNDTSNSSTNHGTGVACMYASTDETNRGLAFGLDSILIENAGSTSTSMDGVDWMVSQAADDPEVINYSWGNGAATGSDWHAFSRFVDALVDDYGITWAKSAGNNGFGTNTMTVPANNYNAMTVANMDDSNTVTRSDDLIWSTSSRGPTVNNRKKPDISAPGNRTMTCNASGGFSNLGGTSSAAPKIGATSLLMTDGGNWDAKAIKAVMINTADAWEDSNTQSTSDDSQVSGSEWNKTYGWGYLDVWHAHFHRTDYVRSSVRPNGQTGDFKLYKGHAYSGDKATLVWERSVEYNDDQTPTAFRSLSDLDLRLYTQSSNALVDSDTSIRDNVHQVAADSSAPVVVKVYAYSSSFDGAASEPFALATEENFSPANGPRFATTLGVPTTATSSSIFQVSASVRNSGDLPAHGVRMTLNLPTGFILISGLGSRILGQLSDGSTSTTQNWTVRAPFTFWPFTRTGAISVSLSSSSYGETFSGAATRTIRVQ